MPGNLPDFFNADISKLKIGSKLFVTDIDSNNCTFLHPDNTVVAQVRMSRNATAEIEETKKKLKTQQQKQKLQQLQNKSSAKLNSIKKRYILVTLFLFLSKMNVNYLSACWINTTIKYSDEKNINCSRGNIGTDYHDTRHNIGFKIVDAVGRKTMKQLLKPDKLGDVANIRHKREELFVLLKTKYIYELEWQGGEVLDGIKKKFRKTTLYDRNRRYSHIDFGTIRIERQGKCRRT